MNEFKDRYKEESAYNDANLRRKIEELEKALENIDKESDELNKSQLIRKLHTVKELIERYKALDMISPNNENYQQVIAEYEYHEEELEEKLNKMEERDMKDSDEERSWEEFREEEINTENEER